MYDDNSRGLESPDRTAASTSTDQRLVTDGGTTWGDLTGFQRDVLETVDDAFPEDAPSRGFTYADPIEPEGSA